MDTNKKPVPDLAILWVSDSGAHAVERTSKNGHAEIKVEDAGAITVVLIADDADIVIRPEVITFDPKTMQGECSWVVHPPPPTNGAVGRIADELRTATTYPILVSDALGGSGSVAPGGVGALPLERFADATIRSVVGRLPSTPKDLEGIVSTTLRRVDRGGRTFVQLAPAGAGAMTRAGTKLTAVQVAFRKEAQQAKERLLNLLTNLHPLRPQDVDPEDVEAEREAVRDLLTDLFQELAERDEPRDTRVDELFDAVGGARTRLATELRGSVTNVTDTGDEDKSRTIELFEVEVDRLKDWWEKFGKRASNDLSTKLDRLSRIAAAVEEAVDDVEDALDSIFIGPEERQLREIARDSGITLDELLSNIRDVVAQQIPRALEQGYSAGVKDLKPTVGRLQGDAETAVAKFEPPHPRIQTAFEELAELLGTMAEQIGALP